MDYIPPPTLARFHLSPGFGRFVTGPIGSGKTTSMIMELLKIASLQKPWQDGRRYTRMAITRPTLQQLRTTVLQDILQLLRGFVHYRVTDSVIQLRTDEIHSDWLMIPLDDPQDRRRLLSTQFTMIWINEFREVPQALVADMSGRVGRYPSKAMGGCTREGIIGDSNPYDDGSDWHEFLELNPRPGNVLFRQPSGMSLEAENITNLPADYYSRLVEAHGTDWVDVHVHGHNGRNMSGEAVFGSMFDASRHVAADLEPSYGRALMILQDFGRTPTSLITQIDARGRWLVLEEVISEDSGLHTFLSQRLKPKLAEDRYAGKRIFVVADPAGRERSQLYEENAFDVLRAHGFHVMAAPTNNLTPRLRAVEAILVKHAGVVIDSRLCPLLIRALKTEYRYKRKKTGVLDDLPEKSHPWSDLADCFQYGAMSINTDLPGRALVNISAPAVPAPSAAAWT